LKRLRGLTIDRANQAWAADITDILIRRGFSVLTFTVARFAEIGGL
jgi:hypothetical protein